MPRCHTSQEAELLQPTQPCTTHAATAQDRVPPSKMPQTFTPSSSPTLKTLVRAGWGETKGRSRHTHTETERPKVGALNLVSASHRSCSVLHAHTTHTHHHTHHHTLSPSMWLCLREQRRQYVVAIQGGMSLRYKAVCRCDTPGAPSYWRGGGGCMLHSHKTRVCVTSQLVAYCICTRCIATTQGCA